MRVYRCFHEAELIDGETIELDEDESRHLGGVLRAREGTEVAVINGRGREALGIVAQAGKKSCRVRIGKLIGKSPRPHPCILACALTKSAAYDDMLHRAVELGMTGFRPIITARTVVDWPEGPRTDRKLERWRKLGIEALKQCERLWLPDFHSPTTFKNLLAEGETVLVLTERLEGGSALVDALKATPPQPVMLCVGPEGGWDAEELELATKSGARLVSMCTRSVLRTETAALAALSAAMMLGPMQ